MLATDFNECVFYDIALYGTEGSTTWNTSEHLHFRIIVAGGGSGYVYTASTASYYPNTLLNSSFYLTNASTTAGNRYGNGMARISAGS